MAEISQTIIEEREEVMVSPTGDSNPTRRAAHFLQPTIAGPVLELPSLPLSSKPPTCALTNLPLKVQFKGWRCPQKNWETWVNQLHGAHQSTWKKAGIYEPIMSSTYHILRHNDLVIGLAEKWCPDTNTFIFPWGEATITLEDIIILGGYSVLGDSVLVPIGNEELVGIEKKLIESGRQITRTRGAAAGHYAWMKHLMGTGLEFEHEAFLALWLSRYVFPSNLDGKIGKHLLPLAIRLARGIPVALAPAVLASLYNDLSSLKERLVASSKFGSSENIGDGFLINLWAPFQLVQLWVWERFPTLRLVPNCIEYGKPRSARWHKLQKLKDVNVRFALDSAGGCFQWRPYAAGLTNWVFHKFYKKNEEWVVVNPDLDQELESFARCLRVSMLVGLDCIEQYLPHRVAMQFGFDQDIPGPVYQSNETPAVAWSNYNRPIKDEKFYLPSRLFESDVTIRYLKWWNQAILAQQDVLAGVVKRRKRSRRLPQRFNLHKGSVHEDRLTISEMLRRATDQHHSVGTKLVSDSNSSLHTQSQTLFSCSADRIMVRGKSSMKPYEKIMREATEKGPEGTQEDSNEKKARVIVNNTLSINNCNGESSHCGTIDKPGLELEARIRKLERVVAVLKAKYGYGFN